MERVRLSIDAQKQLYPIGDLYGVFFEDINHAADGGLYAELIQNRDFEFLPIDNKNYNSLTAYSIVKRTNNGETSKVKVTIETSNPPFVKNPHYAVISVKNGIGGLRNEGYHHGIPINADEIYDATVRFHTDRDNTPVTIDLETEDGTILASKVLNASIEWNIYEASLQSKTNCNKAYFSVVTEGPCCLYLDYVSLFPRHTYNNRKNGLRKDLAEQIAALTPRFVRFPGGCLVHDGSLNAEARDALYFWKNTIGPLSERAARKNNWGYHQTLGLGYYEYFLFCEDIGAKPLPVLPAAYNPHRREAVPISELNSWIQDALDLIEFANGDSTTKWGRIRTELGHENPFGLEYLAIGNEELFAPFLERYPYFHKAIKEHYPEIKLISSVGPFADGADFDLMWKEANRVGADLVDEHYYMAPEWMLKHNHRYDSYQREGAKVFLGEYASLGNCYQNALCEAAYMTGLERNVDKVALACYAPLLCNKDYVNWRPDMIWFDATGCVRTINYYVQQLFMNHQGDYLIQSQLFGGENRREELPDITGKIGFEQENEEVFIRNVSVNGTTLMNDFTMKDRKFVAEPEVGGQAEITFSFVKKKGQKQVSFLFGVKDNLYYRWEIGGWANDMSSIGIYRDGRYGLLTVGSAITIKEGIQYDGKLTINGRSIHAELNGVVYHDFCEQETIIEPLYQSVTADKNGTVYVKAVNVTSEEKELQMKLVQREKFSRVTWNLLQSQELRAENTLEHPDTVTPSKQQLSATQNKLTVIIPPQSVSVFEWKQ